MKILVGYRGKNVGKDLLEQAVKQAKAFDAEVHVVTSMIGGKRPKRRRSKKLRKTLRMQNSFSMLRV